MNMALRSKLAAAILLIPFLTVMAASAVATGAQSPRGTFDAVNPAGGQIPALCGGAASYDACHGM